MCLFSVHFMGFFCLQWRIILFVPTIAHFFYSPFPFMRSKVTLKVIKWVFELNRMKKKHLLPAAILSLTKAIRTCCFGFQFWLYCIVALGFFFGVTVAPRWWRFPHVDNFFMPIDDLVVEHHQQYCHQHRHHHHYYHHKQQKPKTCLRVKEGAHYTTNNPPYTRDYHHLNSEMAMKTETLKPNNNNDVDDVNKKKGGLGQ